MASEIVVRGIRPRFAAGLIVLSGLGLASVPPMAMAKEPSLLAIEVYDGPSGAAYLQLTDVLISGKAEMRDCTPFQNASVDKSSYGKMSKVELGPGGVLERGADGVMHYTPSQGAAICVVPVNVKFEHNASYTLSELAELATLRATPVGPAPGTPTVAPPIKKTVKLVFLSAPNPELAEFLRAERASDIPGWQDFLVKYPTSPHLASAKLQLVTLFLSAGEASLHSYDKSWPTATPKYSDLKTAKTQMDQAHALLPDLPATKSFAEEVHKSFTGITDKGRAELDAYHTALNAHSAGYVHLQNARKFSDIMAGIDPVFPPEQALQGDVQKDSGDFESALQSAGSAVERKQYDRAFTFIVPYRVFADEEPRVAAVVDATYGYHMEQGRTQGLSQNWQGAIKEYELAVKTKDIPEAQDALKNARSEFVIAQDKDAVDRALASSKDFQQQHKMIQAYEVLANLTTHQQSIVADTMTALEPAYVQAASAEAKSLHLAHTPIKGPNDEAWIEKAYIYLQHAYKLSGEDTYKDKMDLDGDELSAYLLEQAKQYLAKPGGSGTELGFACLEEAMEYKASNLGDVRDESTRALPAHSMRSKLSIRVQFRDQTAPGDRTGFDNQLENAIIAGLEDSGVPVKVVHAGEPTAVDPDFQLIGDVLVHHLSPVVVKESLESTYRSGEEPLPNEDWNVANRALDKAKIELQTAQSALQGAESRGNKKEVETLNDGVSTAAKAVEEAEAHLDTIPKSVTHDIIRKYNYTRATTNLTAAIQLQFRVDNSLTGQSTNIEPIEKKAQKTDVVLQDAKPEDVAGIKNSGTTTDSTEFMTELENSAREELVSEVRKRVAEFPLMMYELAKGRETDSDIVGAGELYLRFLNVTKDDKSQERAHAAQFLDENFNLRPASVRQQ